MPSIADDDLTPFGKEEDIEQLSDLVTQFEECALQVKCKLNKLEVVSFKAAQLPATLKMCFLQVKKLVQDENPDFDRSDNIEQAILDTTKECNSLIRELTKLKTEYFQATEAIVNRDLNFVRLQAVHHQTARLQNNSDRLQEAEPFFDEGMEKLTHMKERYEQFEQALFQTKLGQIVQLSQQCDLASGDIVTMRDQTAQTLQQIGRSAEAKQFLTKEHRALLSEIKLAISRAERKFQKSCNAFDALVHQRKWVVSREQESEEIVLKHKPVEMKAMVPQTKQLETLMETLKLTQQHLAKLQFIHEDTKKILFEVQTVGQKMHLFEKSLQHGLQEEFDKITRAVQEKAGVLTGELDELTSRLNSIEDKVPEMCISDQSLLFLNKEVNKNNEMVHAMIDNISAVLEDINEIKQNSKTRQNQDVYPEEVDKIKDFLKQVEKLEVGDF